MNLRRNYNFKIGLYISSVTVLFIVVGFIWLPYDPEAMNAAAKSQFPSFRHILGTDNFGRDIFSRVMQGAGVTLTIAAATVTMGATVGIVIGAFTGYFGGRLDAALMRVNDVVTAFPSILLALVIISIIGPGKYNVIISLGILFIPSFARLTRSEYAKRKNYDYVQNAKLMGVGSLRIMFVHILPNAAPVILSSVAIGFNNAVLAEASMSYLGIGVQPPDASLGRMLYEAQTYFFSAPWYALSAGLAIILLILGFSLISDGLGARR